MASPRVYALLVLLFLLQAHSLQAKGTPNVVSILKKGRQFTTLLTLLQARNLVKPIKNLLKTCDGITIFAPTDKAFNSLPPGTLNSLSPQQQTNVLLLHVLPKYFSFSGLTAAGNPFRTLAPGLTLNITSDYRKIFVSTGVVTTPVNSPLYDKFPLAIFPIDAVLIPARIPG